MRKTAARLTFVSVLILAISPVAMAAVRKGPYLMYGGDPTQMTVLWQLDAPQTCTIRWGLTTDYSSGTASIESSGDTQYEYTVTGLLPATLYYYQVDGIGIGSFRTAPEATGTSVKLLAYSDPQGPPEGFNGACERMIDSFAEDPAYQSLGICAGDWADEDDETVWDTQYFSRAGESILDFLSRIPVAGPRGNHERSGTVFKKYYPYPYVSDFYWSFDYGPVHIIVLDQYVNYSPGSPQYDWLVHDLSATLKPWKIITLHQPGWSAGGVHENDSEVQEYIQPLCLEYGVDLVISGHNHYYARAEVSGVQHLTTGGASDYVSVPVGGEYIVISESTLHHLEIDIQGREASVTARRRDGSVIETFTISHGASIRITSPRAGSTLLAGQTTNIQARVLPAGGTCTGVDFYADGELVGTDQTEPYGVAWIPQSSASTASLVAEASISYSASTETISSAPVTVNITDTPPPEIFNSQVSQSSDDAEESASGNTYITSSDLELVYDSSNQKVGMRFNAITIPQGATISNAYVQFKVNEVNSESTSLTIQGENVDQASTFAGLKYNISSRARTAAAVSWIPSPWATVGAMGADQQTPNIVSVIQEIVDRPGWASGNSLVIIITGTGHRTAEAYDRGTGGAPVLHVEYYPPSGNHVPMAVADAYTTNEEATLMVGAPGVLGNDSDDDGNSLSAVLASGPDHGTLTLSATGSFSYSPSTDFSGTDSFTYHANDGTLNSNVATVTITVSAVNDPPVAIGQSVTTTEDTATGINLTGSDLDGDTLTFIIISQPAHGTLSGLGPTVTYLPAGDYNGPDSFTFKVNDGKLDSGSATVTITVNAVNDPPVAIAQTVTTAEDTAIGITLTGSDPDGDSLAFVAVSQPAHGTLSGAGPTVTYSPAINYNGPDSFTFKVNDGATDSASAGVSITVTPVNDAPVAVNDIYSASEGTLNVAVPGVLGNDSDSDGETLTAVLVGGPTHGSVALNSDGSFIYSPADGYNGTDSFTYQAGDGTTNSSAATVTITISSVNHAPLANAQSVTTAEDTAAEITLTGSDPDGDPITYALVSQPAHGTVSGSGPNVIFTPAVNFNGTDGFTFKVNDGTTDSTGVSVSITVTAVNDAPTAISQDVTTAEDTATMILLTGSDVENSPLTYALVSGPAHGTLSGIAPSVTYTPAADYYGLDSFTFTVSDGGLGSGQATVSITVSPANDAPVANAQAVSTIEDTATAIVLTGNDVEDSPLTYALVSQPTHGTLTGSGPNVIFTPAANYYGSDSFTFRVSDGTLNSLPAAITITVAPVNDAPVANPQSLTTAVNIPVAITLTGSDVDGDVLSYFIVTPPAHGTLSGAAPSLVYAPYAAYSGTDSFTFQINDGSLASGLATVTITVQPSSNQPPVVSAGPDKTATLSAGVTLDGSVSDDMLPNGTLTITWSKVSGPGTVLFTPTNEAITSATFSKAGGYSLRLTASDGPLVSSDDVVVTIRKK